MVLEGNAPASPPAPSDSTERASRPFGTWARIRYLYRLKLPGPCKAVLIALASYEDLRNHCAYPSVATLARDTGFSSDCVRDALHRLENEGWLRISPRQGQTSIYEVAWRKIAQAQPEEQDGKAAETVTATPRSGLTDPWPRARGTPRLKPDKRTSMREQVGRDHLAVTTASSNKTKNLDDSLSRLFEKFQRELPSLSRRRFDWMVRVVQGRAKTPPNSVAFYERSLPSVLENLRGEVESWLAQQAIEWVSGQVNGRGVSGADLKEHLKSEAARNDLPYDADLIESALDRAGAALERKRSLEVAQSCGLQALSRP